MCHQQGVINRILKVLWENIFKIKKKIAYLFFACFEKFICFNKNVPRIFSQPWDNYPCDGMILLGFLCPHFQLMEMFTETIQCTCQSPRGSSLGYKPHTPWLCTSSVTLTVLHYSTKLHLQELSISESAELEFLYLTYYKLSAAAFCLWYWFSVTSSHLM